MNRTTGLFLLCLLLFFGEQASFSQTDSLRVMSWNVENLFDTHHDSLKLDYDFLPDGDCGWTPVRYWQKLHDVARVVMSAGNDDRVPDLVGLCEVENDTVMFDLTRRSALRSCGYQYVMTDSPDARGVDV
ncbi:MAG: endonuclease, partial [Bacteroidaceae bacterium]|nr:endonuclease [Bacteroidaceae bacterium]